MPSHWTGFVPTTVSVLPDGRILAFTAGLTLLVALLFGFPPAPVLFGRKAGHALQLNSRASANGLGNLGKTLVCVQSALCIVLVVGAALFAVTLQKIRSFDPGFRRDGVLLITLFEKPGREKILDRTLYFRELAEKLGTLPGVTGVSYSWMGPAYRIDYQRAVSLSSGDGGPVQAVNDFVGPQFFRVLGMHVLTGREFNWRDDTSSGPVAIVSESLAGRLFPGRTAIGQRIDLGSDPEHQRIEIVGVVNSASLWRVQSIRPMAVYRPLLQQPGYNQALIDIRTAGDPHRLMRAARQIVEVAGYQYPLRLQTLQERSEMMLANERVLAIIAVFLAALALLLAAIGLYGVLAYAVTRRTSEMGIRLALGAHRRELVRLVVGEGMRLVGVGVAAGIAVEVMFSRLIDALLFRVAGHDPVVIAVCCGTLICVSLAAAFGPAWRAAGLDPMTALREE